MRMFTLLQATDPRIGRVREMPRRSDHHSGGAWGGRIWNQALLPLQGGSLISSWKLKKSRGMDTGQNRWVWSISSSAMLITWPDLTHLRWPIIRWRRWTESLSASLSSALSTTPGWASPSTLTTSMWSWRQGVGELEQGWWRWRNPPLITAAGHSFIEWF